MGLTFLLVLLAVVLMILGTMLFMVVLISISSLFDIPLDDLQLYVILCALVLTMLFLIIQKKYSVK